MASASEAGADAAGQQAATAGSSRRDRTVIQEGGSGAQLTDLQARMRSHERPGEGVSHVIVMPAEIESADMGEYQKALGGHAGQWVWCLAGVAANMHAQPQTVWSGTQTADGPCSNAFMCALDPDVLVQPHAEKF